MFDSTLYEIAEFNYLKVNLRNKVSGQIKTTCPHCTEDRKNKTDKSLSVNVTTGEYNCHHCGKTGNIHKWRRKGARKTYVRPQWKNKTELSDKLVKYFESRAISQKTLELMKITEEMEWMPQTEKPMNCVVFNYFYQGELINKKFRTGGKHFKLVTDAEKILYNLDSVFEAGNKSMVITEGECFDADAEVLTTNYWKKIKDLSEDDLVAIVDDKGKIIFEKPLGYVKKYYNGKLLKYTNSRNSYYSQTTPKHNLTYINKHNEFAKIKAEDVNTSQIKIPRTALFNGKGLDVPDDMLRLYVAISADFTIREAGDIYGSFKKKRKKDRIESILNNLGLRYSINIDSRNYYSVFIHRNQGLRPFKIFPKEWVYELSHRQINLIMDEIILWDGNSVNNRSMKEYNSKEIENIKFIQTLSHLNGTISTIHKKRKNNYGEWYKVSILKKKYSTITSNYKTEIDYNGYVYCVTVSSGMILVKQNNIITISGNCDALSYIESGINFAVSVPNGASTNTDYLDNFMPLFSHIEKVYLATDNDTKGLILRGELLRRFGAERCYKVDFEDCKDANEYLLKYGRTALAQTLDSAKRFPFEGLVTVLDIEEELNDLYENGIGTGYNFGDEQLDKICRVDLGKLLVLTGIPSHGKTTALNYLITKLNITQGWKTAFYSPESFPVKMHVSKMEELLVGKRFSGERRMNRAEHQAAMQYMNDNFFFIQPEERKTLENILKSARQAVRAYGVKVIVIDPWNRLDEMSDDTNAIGREINKVSNFAAENNVLAIIVAHPTKLKKKDKSMYYEEPTPYDIKGSSCWYDMPDIILTWHRDFDHDYNQLRVYKVREEYLGQPGALRYKYNINNRRISSINDNLGAEVPLLWDNRNWLTGEGNIVRDNQMSDLEYLQTPIKRKYDTPINFYEPTQAGDDPDRPPF